MAGFFFEDAFDDVSASLWCPLDGTPAAAAKKQIVALAVGREDGVPAGQGSVRHGPVAVGETVYRALDAVIRLRERKLANSTLKGEANLLVMPDLSSANVAYQAIKIFGDSLAVGPILLGTRKPAHIVTGSVTARGVMNIASIAVAEACAGK